MPAEGKGFDAESVKDVPLYLIQESQWWLVLTLPRNDGEEPFMDAQQTIDCVRCIPAQDRCWCPDESADDTERIGLDFFPGPFFPP